MEPTEWASKQSLALHREGVSPEAHYLQGLSSLCLSIKTVHHQPAAPRSPLQKTHLPKFLIGALDMAIPLQEQLNGNVAIPSTKLAVSP